MVGYLSDAGGGDDGVGDQLGHLRRQGRHDVGELLLVVVDAAEEELRLDVAEPHLGPVLVEVRQLEGTRDDGCEGVVGVHWFIFDVAGHDEKLIYETRRKARNKQYGRGALP